MRKQPWRISLVKRVEETMINNKMVKLVYDGSKAKGRENSVQTTEPTMFTRKYQLILLNDGPVNTMVKFVYNYRDGYADFDIFYHKFRGAADSSNERLEGILKDIATGTIK